MVGLTRKIGFILLVLAVWASVASRHLWSPLLLPSPQSVAQSLVDGCHNLGLPLAILASLGRMAVGYGLTLIAATLAMHYETARRAAIVGGLVALDLAIFALAINTHSVLGEAQSKATARHWPLSTSQTRMVSSQAHETAVRPSADNATLMTLLV